MKAPGCWIVRYWPLGDIARLLNDPLSDLEQNGI